MIPFALNRVKLNSNRKQRSGPFFLLLRNKKQTNKENPTSQTNFASMFEMSSCWICHFKMQMQHDATKMNSIPIYNDWEVWKWQILSEHAVYMFLWVSLPLRINRNAKHTKYGFTCFCSSPWCCHSTKIIRTRIFTDVLWGLKLHISGWTLQKKSAISI